MEKSSQPFTINFDPANFEKLDLIYSSTWVTGSWCRKLLFLFFLLFILFIQLCAIISTITPVIQSTTVIRRDHSATMTTVHNGTVRQLTMYGTTSLKNMRVHSRRFQQCSKYDTYAPCTCIEAHTTIHVDAQMEKPSPQR